MNKHDGFFPVNSNRMTGGLTNDLQGSNPGRTKLVLCGWGGNIVTPTIPPEISYLLLSCHTVVSGGLCALQFQNVSGIFPPDSAVVRPAVNIKDNIYDMEDGGHPAWDVCCTGLAIDSHGYVDGDIYMARLCLLGCSGMENIIQRNEEYVDVRRLNHRHTVSWDPDVGDSRPSRCVMIACV